MLGAIKSEEPSEVSIDGLAVALRPVLDNLERAQRSPGDAEAYLLLARAALTEAIHWTASGYFRK